MKQASDAYARFLAPYLEEGVRLQAISFGSHASFDPDRLKITGTAPTDEGVEVAFTITDPLVPPGNDYVAELVGRNGALRLRQIWYLDPYPENGQDRLPFL